MSSPFTWNQTQHLVGWRRSRHRLRLPVTPFASALIVIAIVTGSWNYFAGAAALGQARREREVIARSDRLLSTLKDLETGMRGYALVGRPEYLEPYDAAMSRVDREFAEVDASGAAAGEEAVAALAPVRALVSEEKGFSAAAVRARREQGFDAASTMVADGEGKRLMDAIRVATRNAHDRADAGIVRIENADHLRSLILTLVSLACTGVAIALLARLAFVRRRESQRSSGMLEDVLGNAPVGLGFLDRDLTIQHMNQALSHMCEGGLEAKLGAPLWASYPALKAQLMPLVEAARDRGLTSIDIDVQVQSTTTEGATRHLRMGFYPLRQDDGPESRGGVGVAVADMTAAKLSEEQVRAGEATLRTVLETLPVGVLIAEAPSGRITGHNGRAETILGHGVMPARLGEDAARWVGFHEDGRPVTPTEWPLIKVIRNGEQKAELEVDYQRGDGQRAWIGFSGAPMRDSEGQLLGGVVVLSDIDARKRSERMLAAAKHAAEEANLAKSTFIANMSHELRTPLSAIIGYSEMMLEEVEDGATGPDLAGDLHKVESNARHLLGLINDVLDLSKVESGKMDVYAERFEVAPLVEEVASAVESLVGKKGNRIEVRLGPNLEFMESDVTKIRQILLNLLSNAAKFTEAGTIVLAASRENGDGGRLIFSVSDTGMGMSEEQLAKLFQRFTQADSSTTRRFGGTGLGLSLTKAFADILDGTVSVESEPGRGTTFTVALPARYVAPVLDMPESAEDEQGSGRDLVLVIDDDADQRALMTRFLAREGFRARTAGDGPAGLDLARALKPRAILLDVMMPGLDGWSVLSALKADPDLRDIPVVMVTFVEQRGLAAALGAADYVLKPVRWERFKAVMDRFRAQESGVLVVDDDPDTRIRLRSMLERDNWAVTEAENGRHALDLFPSTKPSVVVLDLTMPVMDGFAFLAELRARPDGVDVPVVVLTAHSLSNDDRRRLRGANQVLNKGDISLRTLVERLRQLAEEPRREEDARTGSRPQLPTV